MDSQLPFVCHTEATYFVSKWVRRAQRSGDVRERTYWTQMGDRTRHFTIHRYSPLFPSFTLAHIFSLCISRCAPPTYYSQAESEEKQEKQQNWKQFVFLLTTSQSVFVLLYTSRNRVPDKFFRKGDETHSINFFFLWFSIRFFTQSIGKELNWFRDLCINCEMKLEFLAIVCLLNV